jgi:hypothetical protein
MVGAKSRCPMRLLHYIQPNNQPVLFIFNLHRPHIGIPQQTIDEPYAGEGIDLGCAPQTFDLDLVRRTFSLTGTYPNVSTAVQPKNTSFGC